MKTINKSNEDYEMGFEKELEILINKYSIDNKSDTPDFILAQYVKLCLDNYAIFNHENNK